MTRIFTDGAEMGDTSFWSGTHYMTAVTTPTPVGGEWIYNGGYLGEWKNTIDLGEFYLRYRVRCTYPPSMGGQVLGWRHGGATIGWVSVDVLGRFIACVTNVGTVGVSSLIMNPNQWYMIEVHYYIDNLNGRFEVYVDGTLVIDYTGDTLSDPLDPHIDNIYWNSNVYVSTYIDDLALNDTSGVDDNSWCGDGIITKMYPDGDGAHNNWDGSDGDSVSNYLLVDEFPNDGDTTYVSADGTDTGHQDQYTLNDLDYTNKTVLRIYPEARARKTAPDGTTLKLGILPNGGVDDLSAAQVLTAGGYTRIVGDDYKVNPLDSSPWDETSLDSLQVILEVG